MTLARAASGLLYQSDGSLTGWTNGGGWTSVSDPTYCAFDPMPLAILEPTHDDADGLREVQPYVEDGVWWFSYDAGDGVNPWRTFMASSHDRCRTAPTRHGARNDGANGLAKVGGGTVAATAMGYFEKRGSAYVIHRMIADSASTTRVYGYGLPIGPYTYDIWTATSILGPYTGVRELSIGTGDDAKYPACSILDSGTYYSFVGAYPHPVWLCTASTATGDRTLGEDPLITDDQYGSGYSFENCDVFYSVTLSKWFMLGNGYALPPVGITDRNLIMRSDSLTDWSASSQWHIQCVSPMDSTHAIGVIRRFTGPDGALVYDATTGMIPVVYDGDPTRFAAGNYATGRRIKAAVLEPSASALRYGGSGDTTARSLTRSLSCTDVVLEFACQPTGFNGGGGSLLIDLVDGSNNGYRFTFTSDSHASIQELAGGTPSTLAAGSGSQAFDASFMLHRLKVSIQGGSLVAKLNGETQATATDSTTTTFTTLKVTGKGLDCDVRCLSARTSDTVIVQGLTPGEGCFVRGYGELPAGGVVADGSGVGTYSQSHYPLWGLEVDGSDYTPSGGIWGGDTLVFSGLPTSSAVAIPTRVLR